MKQILLSTAAVILSFSVGTAHAAVSSARATELAFHRIERLVTLGKASEHFLTHLKTLELTPNNPGFKATVSLYPGADGSAHQLDVFLDADGRPSKEPVHRAGGDPVNAPAWPQMDAITLAESGIHYLVENGQEKAELKPFLNNLSSFDLGEGQVGGQPVARVHMRSSASSKVLEVLINLDGTLNSAKVLP